MGGEAEDLSLRDIIDFVDRDEQGLETPLAPLVDGPEGGEKMVVERDDGEELNATIEVEVQGNPNKTIREMIATVTEWDLQRKENANAVAVEVDEAGIEGEQVVEPQLAPRPSPPRAQSVEPPAQEPVELGHAVEEDIEVEPLNDRLPSPGAIAIGDGGEPESPLAPLAVEEELETGPILDEEPDPTRKEDEEVIIPPQHELVEQEQELVIEEKQEPVNANEDPPPFESLDENEVESDEESTAEVYDRVLEVLELLVEIMEEISVEGEEVESDEEEMGADGMEGLDVVQPPQDDAEDLLPSVESSPILRGTLSPVFEPPAPNPAANSNGPSDIKPNSVTRNSSSPPPLPKSAERRRSRVIESDSSEDEMALVPDASSFEPHQPFDGVTIPCPFDVPEPRGPSRSTSIPRQYLPASPSPACDSPPRIKKRRNSATSTKSSEAKGKAKSASFEYPFSPPTPITKTYLDRRKPTPVASQSSSSPRPRPNAIAGPSSERSTREDTTRSSRPSRNARRYTDWWVLPSRVPDVSRSRSRSTKSGIGGSSARGEDEDRESCEEEVNTSAVRRKGNDPSKKLQKF